MFNALLLAFGLPLLSLAISLQPRAGAPIPKKIPSACNVVNPLLCTSAASCSPESYTQVRPKASTLKSRAFLYAYYLQSDSIADPSLQRCLETCYGYGKTGDCKSVYRASNYPTPPQYGTRDGPPSTACLLFTTITIADLEVVLEVQRANYTSTVVRSISCPV